MDQHFAPTDARVDATRLPVIGPLLRAALKRRPFQFLLILPNQLIFWLVIFTGFLGFGTVERNFSTVITWYIWFCVVFLLMVGVGRGWCVMCPFGGAGEWVQRKTLWKRLTSTLGLHRQWPQSWAKWGILPSVGVFVALTWAEEFFNIAAPGKPLYTGILVAFIITFAITTLLVFDRRTFCRYVCPLTALIGTVGATGMVAGFRTRDRDVCLTCTTKDCMRGSDKGYGCPWYTWPGSADSNLMCGLCSECMKNCPHDNVGLFLQPPLTSVVAPLRRRWDIAVAAVVLFGLVVFQQVNALPAYTAVDDWLNGVTRFPAYPNPVDFFGIITAIALLVTAWGWGLWRLFGGRVARIVGEAGPFRAEGKRPFTAWLVPLGYALIPLTAMDYLARQLPKFWLHAARIVPAISDPFAWGWNLFGTAHSALYSFHILSINGVIVSQVAVVGIGTLGSLYAGHKIVQRDLVPLSRHPQLLAVASTVGVLVIGATLALLYVTMGGAE
jgi:polyferredoxin